MSVVIETTIGDITVDLYLKERPNTCLNFLKLCKIKYYNLCIFHKVERNFIAQTGDPTCTGRGGESVFCQLYGEQAKYFDAEIKPRLKHEKIGTLSMVNNGNNMNGSQFFLTLGENLSYLDEVHTVFGEVAEGFDILLKLNEAICDPNNRPYQDIRITHTVVLHDPYDDPTALVVPDASPIPTREQLESNYIGADEEIDDTKGKNAEEIEEKIKESEAKARATILEMIGDIPDADVKPPENVLFVCKLNPVTTSEDLEIIFSRFGSIVSCEVIRDKKSDESLQYAFIEFEKEEDCENAYFKMDNVLIDDRRIHVDFSQSVSKLNFNAQNKLVKGKSGRFQNFVIKDKGKKSDQYEMIFDMDSGSAGVKQDDKKHRRSPGHKGKQRRPHSREDSTERNHRKVDSSGRKYMHKDKYPDCNQSQLKQRPNYPSKHSDNGKLIQKKSKRHDTSDETDSSPNRMSNKHSYRKKSQDNSSNSSSSESSKPATKHPKNRSQSKSKSYYQKPEPKIFLERKEYNSSKVSHSVSPEPSYSKRKAYKQTSKSPEKFNARKTTKHNYYHESRSSSSEPAKLKTKSRKDVLSHPRPHSKSPESYKHKALQQKSGRRSQSSSPEAYTQKMKPGKNISRHTKPHSRSPDPYKLKALQQKSSRRSQSSSPETHSRNTKSGKEISKHTRPHSRSPEPYKLKASQQRSSHKSQSSSPEAFNRKSKVQKRISRSHSRSPVASSKTIKSSKHTQSHNKSPLRSSETSKYQKKPSKHVLSHSKSRSRTPESFKQDKKTLKNKLHNSRASISPHHRSKRNYSSSGSSSRSPEVSNKKPASKHSSSSKVYSHGYSSKYEKLKSKSKNLTEYSDHSSSESDQLKVHKAASLKALGSTKKHSHKEHKHRKHSHS